MSAATADAAVLLSGSGRTLENLLAKIAADQLPLRIVCVVSSRQETRGVQIAQEAQIPCAVFRRKDYPSTSAHNAAINAWLVRYAPQMIVLAGYLCYYMAPPGFDGPVVNIHPALLPKYGGKGYYGDRVHAAVLAAGERESGCTVHRVDDQYDHGQILAQSTVPVLPGDDIHSLAARIFTAECDLYPRVLADLARELLRREP